MHLQPMFGNGLFQVIQNKTILDVISDVLETSDQEDAFFIFDAGDVVKKIKAWKYLMPRVKPFYAVKCNDHPAVLEILAHMGIGFDCASKTEINKVMEAGVEPSRIIFAHPCKPASHVRHARACDVQLMTFDNAGELAKIKSLYPDAKLVLRIRCDALDSQCELGIKFGAEPEDVEPLLKIASELNLNVVGVSFHVGSGCREPKVFLRAIAAARDAFDKAETFGFKMNLLDIGGGYPGDSESALDEIALYVNEALSKHFPDPAVEVIAEPGRYVVASSFTAVTQVISVRKLQKKGSGESYMYYINDGVYGSFNCILYDHQVVTPSLVRHENDDAEEKFECSIWGPTCDGLDQVVASVRLPKLKVGDWIMWRDMGAYTLSAAGTFNGFPVPSVHAVLPYHAWLNLNERSLFVQCDSTNKQPNDLVDKKQEFLNQQPFPCLEF